MNRFIINNDGDVEFPAEEVDIMEWGPDEQEGMIRHFVGIETEEDEKSDDEEEVVITEITEMSMESLMELIKKNAEEGIDNKKLEMEMSMRAQYLYNLEMIENGGEVMTNIAKYELLMQIRRNAARWETFNEIMRRESLEGETPLDREL